MEGNGEYGRGLGHAGGVWDVAAPQDKLEGGPWGSATPPVSIS